MTSLYVAASRLHEITLEVLRMHAPGVMDIRIVRRGGSLVPGNWCIAWLNVLAEDYGAARDEADRLEALDHWIMVPDEHPLDGQVFGKEVRHEWQPGPTKG